MVPKSNEFVKYGIVALGLLMYFTSIEQTTRNLGGFIALIGLLLLLMK